MPEVDVIIITRGGGSVEDLLPFSNEHLVRMVAQATTPVVSAIGHEQDTPLLDFVADLRASTPTDAAKRVVPSFAEQERLVTELHSRSRRCLLTLVEHEGQRLVDAGVRMRSAIAYRLERDEQDIAHLLARLRTLSPQATLDRGYAIVITADGRIVRTPDDVPVDDVLDIRVAEGKFAAVRRADGGR
jgi:exodeoxyribonuclease VII large subunit